jgi:ferredoxin
MNGTINISSSCNVCGLCAEVCPNKIIFKSELNKMQFRDDRIDLCIKCGQCMAICPSKSIVVEGLSYEEDFFELPAYTDLENGFNDLIQTRRSIRNFKDKAVSKELLNKIVNAISYAPPGFTPLKTEITVISDPEIIKKSLSNMIKIYESWVKGFKSPIIRFFMKKGMGKKKYLTMKEHVLPMLISRLPELNDGTEDTITRHAPAMILFHSDRNKDTDNDIIIAATYGILTAHSLGLGATIMSIIPPAIDQSSELRELFKIPESNKVISSMIIGHPKYKYQRAVKRNLKNIDWL